MSAVTSISDQQLDEKIILAHGGGGELTRRLIAERILPRLTNSLLSPLTDGAVLSFGGGRLAFTTDSFVVQPLEFPGGDIGKLAVCGTVNDLAMMGATPRALSLALILEEGLSLSVLDRVVASIASAAQEAGVAIATGDTKVVENRGGGGLMITTAGVGEVREKTQLGAAHITADDVVIVSGRIAEHGLAVMSVREGLAFQTRLESDVAPLCGLASRLLEEVDEVRFLRDPTRGGVAGVLADLAEETRLSIEVDEDAIPLSRVARHTAELLGLDPLTVANEGKLVAVVSARQAQRAVNVLRDHPLGKHAAAIGCFTTASPPLVELKTRSGGRRIVQRPYGEELPRIC